MRYGLFSDIHSNLEAFEATLALLESNRIDRYVFLGDLVGYGADPQACIALLQKLQKEKGCVCLAGNHDYAVCGMTPFDYYARKAQDAIVWTQTRLSDEEKNFLKGMTLREDFPEMTIVHANLEDPAAWAYVLDIDDAFPNFKILQTPVCFIGHSHRPVIFSADESVDWFLADRLMLETGKKYIINIGSVGQPRDGNPKACCAVFDTETNTVDILRTDYNIALAQEKIIRAGLPRILAERLALGK